MLNKEEFDTPTAWDPGIIGSRQAFWLLHITSPSLAQAENKDNYSQARIEEKYDWNRHSAKFLDW